MSPSSQSKSSNRFTRTNSFVDRAQTHAATIRELSPDDGGRSRSRGRPSNGYTNTNYTNTNNPNIAHPRQPPVPGAFPFSLAELTESETRSHTDMDPRANLPISSLLLRHISSLGSNPEAQPFIPQLNSLARMIRLAERKLLNFPLLVSIHRSTDFPPLAQAAVLLVAVLAMLRRAMKTHARLVSNLFGAIYPALQSILAVERPRADDDERLLTYWSIFGLFSVVDHASSQIQILLPGYYSSKMAILYWLYAKDGALKLYRSIYRPLLVKYFAYPSQPEPKD
ncbi:hypothetical protein HDU80_005748 [Chytriomyces hyalinus]|nr:hypothetical protein HDU80_005748 [Chytriomyces hyalinus]